MKGKELIINFIVIVALIGYILCSSILFIEAFDGDGNTENSALMYITSALTGLVGGIVAAAFGVESTDSVSPSTPPQSVRQQKFQRVGAYASLSQDVNTKEKMGNLYAWAYILVGLISVIIWIILEIHKNKEATESITNTGMTFMGMVVAIVSAYFKR